jgi:1-deoxy-D-xylulose-5-phosphate synthase
MRALEIGKGVIRRQGKGVAILNFGTLLADALPVADTLNATVADMRFVKPLDHTLIEQLAADHKLLVTLEENAIAGGAGAGVSEYLNNQGITIPILHLGLPDEFIDHGKHSDLLRACELDSNSIQHAIEQRLKLLNIEHSMPESNIN